MHLTRNNDVSQTVRSNPAFSALSASSLGRVGRYQAGQTLDRMGGYGRRTTQAILRHGTGFAISNRKIVINWYVIEVTSASAMWECWWSHRKAAIPRSRGFSRSRARDLALSGEKELGFLRRVAMYLRAVEG